MNGRVASTVWTLQPRIRKLTGLLNDPCEGNVSIIDAPRADWVTERVSKQLKEG